MSLKNHSARRPHSPPFAKGLWVPGQTTLDPGPPWGGAVYIPYFPFHLERMPGGRGSLPYSSRAEVREGQLQGHTPPSPLLPCFRESSHTQHGQAPWFPRSLGLLFCCNGRFEKSQGLKDLPSGPFEDVCQLLFKTQETPPTGSLP